MGKTISTKSVWVKTDGWRGYSQPVNAIGGANNTGMWSDSPCRTDVCQKEIKEFRSKLRKEKIRSKEIVSQTSNVFCVHHYVLVDPENRERAIELAKEHEKDCRLFYAV